jgi:tetratricopeptide (TPR) repeat protein
MDKKIKTVALLLLGVFLATFSVNAQTLNDAMREIKKGDQEKRADNYTGAIEAYANCVSICEQLGSEADELEADAQKKLVKSHLDYGNELLKQDKYDQALDEYNKVLDLGDKYNQNTYKEKAETNISQVWYAKGKAEISNKNYEDALKYLDKAIEGNPEYGWAYIRKAQIYMAQEQPENLMRAVDEAVTIGEETNNDNVVKTATQVGYKYFYNHGATALKNKNYSKAAENLEKATKYNGSATIYHYLALSYGQLSEFEKAIEKEEKAIEMMEEEKSEEEMAKYYYTLAGYYVKVGNDDKACSAYKNAAYGQYKANAEYQIKHILKCN